MKKQAVNPYLPNFEYVPDAEPYVFNDRVYIYGSHDKFNSFDFCMNDYVCWSASIDDLSDWRYEGVIYRKIDDPLIDDPINRRMFAPDLQKGVDGRYYLYYAFDFSGIIGVAVCDTPAGKFEYYGHVKYKNGTLLGQSQKDYFQYDPGVLVDNNQIYLYTGFCIPDRLQGRFNLPKDVSDGAMVTVLDTDMKTIKQEPKIIIPDSKNSIGTSFEKHAFFEAPSMRKYNDKYYLIYSSENSHELCYATSNFPDKDFQYGGVIISNADIGYLGRVNPINYFGTNHGSIVKIKNSWYVFYHRQTNGNPYSRQGCAEKIHFNEDGTINQVEMTSCGLNDGYLVGKGEYKTSIACALMSKFGAGEYKVKSQISDEHPFLTQEGDDREENPGQYITNIKSGTIIGFKYFYIERLTEITVKVRGTAVGVLEVFINDTDEKITEIRIEPSENWIALKEKTNKIENQDVGLWFKFVGSGELDFESFELI